jgi:hypothetical protein
MGFLWLCHGLVTDLQNKFIIKIRDFSMLKLVNIIEVKYMHEERMCGRESNVVCGIKK